MSAREAVPVDSRLNRFLAWGFLALAILAVIAIRWRLLTIPLERDEGEFGYMGQQILQGIPPYQTAGNMKLPGTYLAYAAIMAVFGQTCWGIHFALLLLNLGTSALLMLIARRFLDLAGAVTATAAYALLSIEPVYLGLEAHATAFVVFFALLGFWCLLRAEQAGSIFGCIFAGLAFGAAFLMKQPGIFFGLFGGIYLLGCGVHRRLRPRQLAIQLSLFALGCLFPYGVVCLWMAWAGVFPKFWYWTVTYAGQYGSSMHWAAGLNNLRVQCNRMFQMAPAIWALAAAGVGCLFHVRWRERAFVGGLLLTGALAVCPGWYFRDHYFLQVLPGVAVSAGLAVTRIGPWLATRSGIKFPIFFLLAAAGCALSLCGSAQPVFFDLSPTAACRWIYQDNPFPEAPVLAQYLAQHTRAGDPIAVLGDEPEICFYAHRPSASSRLYPSQLMDPRPYTKALQEDYIREIETNSPPYAVWVMVRTSWLARRASHPRLFNWAREYLSTRYRPVGGAWIVSSDQTLWFWGDAVTNVSKPTLNTVLIYQRISGDAPQR